MGAGFFQKGGVLLKLFGKSFTKNLWMSAPCFVGGFFATGPASGKAGKVMKVFGCRLFSKRRRSFEAFWKKLHQKPLDVCALFRGR
ncbi:hypothetical protein, partial [Novacetimonas maltaceti]|uniref:hypothetical protein n=1 Tax=Novacetimonas maltaceti TaxID=1203393 RepID=UPI001CA5A4E8